MTTAIARESNKQVARPLHVLAELIKKDLKNGDAAAQNAGMPHYKAAGEKFIEARKGNNWTLLQLCKWTAKQFDRGRTQTLLYMKYADATSGLSVGTHYKSQEDFRSRGLGHDRRSYTERVFREWQRPVDAIADRARRDMERIQEEDLTRKQEREAETKLALRLIDIGYKVLAKELHPDSGGSRDAMQRLVRVRDRLKASA